MAKSWKFMRDSFMSCDELLWALNLSLVHGLFMKVHELWWMTSYPGEYGVNYAMAN